MSRRVTATWAKNNFGKLLEDVALFGRVDIVRHGRAVATMVSPRSAEARKHNHMLPARLAREARMLNVPSGFDDD